MSGIGGGTTPLDASPEDLRREAAHAHAWYRNFVGDVFGKTEAAGIVRR
jgi:hypothetical protein